MWGAPGMRINLCWEAVANLAKLDNAPNSGFDRTRHPVYLTQTNPSVHLIHAAIVLELQRVVQHYVPIFLRFQLPRLISQHAQRSGQRVSLHRPCVTPAWDSCCSISANSQRPTAVESRRQRLGEFDPRRFVMALLDVALFLGLVAAGSAAQAQAIVQSAPSTVALHFDAAQVAYERNHWPEAYAALSALADSGHTEGARMALQMRQYGLALYGREFVASAGQVAQWKRSWGCSGDTTRADCRQRLAAP